MCDYSLMMLPNRLASRGEHLVAHRFNSGTTGLVPEPEFAVWRAARPVSLWGKIKDCFTCSREPALVACVPPGARLRLEGLGEPFRRRFGLDSSEDATFTQVSLDASGHRDALRFLNGTTVLLQSLPEGQTLTVLRLSSTEDFEPEPETADSLQPSVLGG